MSEREQYRYHGRVLRQDGWIVLQYWFFYAFNDWRSGFYGANDHEGDWEKILVYLSESETGEVRPEWVAYAAMTTRATTSAAVGTIQSWRRWANIRSSMLVPALTPATTRKAST